MYYPSLEDFSQTMNAALCNISDVHLRTFCEGINSAELKGYDGYTHQPTCATLALIAKTCILFFHAVLMP